jgi:pyruvate decarboxylase
MYEKLAEHITAATTATVTQEIDWVLAVMLEQSRPVYIGIPTDIVYALRSLEDATSNHSSSEW